jgi:hypothetical protein
MGKDIRAYSQTKKYKAVRDSMLRQLKEQGADENHYIDQVSTYMDCWIDVQLLTKDIRERGATVEVVGRSGEPELRKNESVGERIRIIAIMLRIQSALGLNQNAPPKPRLPDAPTAAQKEQRTQDPIDEGDEDDEDF